MSDMTPTQSVISELRADLALANRATALADAIVRELRAPGEYTVTICVPVRRRDEWPVLVEAPDGTVRELTMRQAEQEKVLTTVPD